MDGATKAIDVGQRIKWARRESGLSQERLAREIGTTRQVVIRWERGKHLPNSLSRERLAEVLGQEADFFTDTEVVPNGAPFRDGPRGGAPRAGAGKAGSATAGKDDVAA